ncbi:MAG: hypothetical protein M1816_002856 [Peltula sp. TS41687]|nr:MAG: hypothetical protein M1816_002856 [Peltula sp. TS41687]
MDATASMTDLWCLEHKRVAACIELNGLGHIIRPSTRSSQTSKALPPAVWNHGASALGTTEGFADGLRRSKRQGDGFASQRTVLQTVPDGIYLEFLYPAKTLTLVRKLSNYDPVEWKCRPCRKVGLNHKKRWYASAAPQVVTERNHQHWDGMPSSDRHSNSHPTNNLASQLVIELAQPTKTDDSVASLQSSVTQQNYASLRPDSVRHIFNMLPRPGTAGDNDRAWQIYRAGETISKVEILEYLSSSTRVIDAERVENVFQELSYAERVPQAYRAMIAALIALGKLDVAINIHTEARERQFQTSYGTNLLFANAIDRKEWRLAFRTWHTYWTKIHRDRIMPALWDDVIKLPRLQQRAVSLAVFLKEKVDPASGKVLTSRQEQFLKFTSGVVRTAVFNTKNPKEERRMKLLINELTSMKPDKKYYERAIMHFFQVKMTRLALWIYEFYRNLPLYQSPQRTMLDAAFFAYSEDHNLKGIQLVLDDWTKHYGTPNAHTYREAMRYFARRGDAAVVSTLFEKFRELIPRIRTTAEFGLLLQAYARQGELRKTIDGFNEITSKYGLKPDRSCWNTLLYAHSKAEDMDGAQKCLDHMRRFGLSLDSYTIGTLINMCGRRGDVEGVMEFLDLAKEEGVAMTAEIYDGIILAYINNGNVDHAEDLAEDAVSMNLKGSYTRMWNYVLHARAFQRRLDRTTEVFRRMKELKARGVPVDPDHLTYATLIQAFVLLNYPVAANEILEEIMIPEGDIQVTTFHYALVMAGYLRAGMPKSVYRIFRRMLFRGLKPTMSTHITLVKAGMMADKQIQRKDGKSDDEDDGNTVVNAEAVLDQVLADTDISDMMGPDPIMWKGRQPINTAYPAAYFDFLISVYGRQKAFDKIESLYKSYLRFAKDSGREEVIGPPLRMVNALMMASSQRGDFDEVERCWRLATTEAAKQARKWNLSDTAKNGWVAPAYRYQLAFPLTQYIMALDEQGRTQDIKDTVNQMLWDGYKLDKTNWNVYIQLLARHGQYQDAFGHCEFELMPGWKGWREHRRVQGLPRLRSKAYNVSDTARPFYKTMLYLARATVNLRPSNYNAMAASYPRTLAAIRGLPYREDRLQASVLARP